MRVCKKEPVFLLCNGGLVNVNNKKEPVCLKCREGLVNRKQ